MKRLYKIHPAALWALADDEGRVPWAPIDVADGFVHLSSADQVRETAEKHFAGQTDLVLVVLDEARIPSVTWEPSRGGALFPHVYGDIPLSAVVEVLELVGAEAGAFAFPDDLSRAL